MNIKILPNVLSLLRVAMIPPFLMLFFAKDYERALCLFFIMGVTDGLDGWLARRLDSQSWWGSFLDPMADKILVGCSFFSLAWVGMLPWWLVFLCFFRDITLLLGVLVWYWLLGRQMFCFKPTYLGKFNTCVQLLLVVCCITKLAILLPSSEWITVLIWVTATTTSATYCDYAWTWGKKLCQRSD
ncbi:MAG: CDP-alcohol phosphatidyltransferase family protein [Legionellaceae bacterium]|nr:CDP-alcohol phosphatidyltransferase family protein [Legionellaceae bacterium]